MKCVLIAGSNRRQASSTLLLRYMAKRLQEKGHEAEVLELFQLKLPLYSPDDDYAGNREVAALDKSVADADAIILATPEYHAGMSGVLKNALDFLEKSHFSGKPVLLASSAGGAVGVSSLSQMQTIIRNLHGLVSPEWVSLGGDARQFGDDGEPAASGVKERVERALEAFEQLAVRMSR
ncbi:NAD(P)H-dependent oxidoreductase [Xylanibacillus composti]|uniref:FMN reductase n=1 Tax=Xylanibacillus composti TaxID=1572762 RepID=A0A8J4M0I5_9BACL|nr:NADPH-dependent FMN reductase [Xylanibacillus composti]MDT9723979.1 NAD(P)H-dependent oxidoreductase [Xylanibacillus composti]GIQ67860.1 FMN reductase [Xylanibacillus composti]